ncbi:MAG: hypothetical protein ACLT8E_05080 [Akkermansia sp.]
MTGAAVVNIPDTVGYTMPEEYYRLISYLNQCSQCEPPGCPSAMTTWDGRSQFPGWHPRRVTGGGTINGIGERAGTPLGGSRHGGRFPSGFLFRRGDRNPDEGTGED